MTTDLERRLRALRDDLPEPPRAIDPDTLPSGTDVSDLAAPVPFRARRTRWAVAALVAAALVVGIVVTVQVVRGGRGVDRHDATDGSVATVTTLGPTDVDGQVVHDGDRVEGDGAYYVPGDGTVWFCAPAPVAVASGPNSCAYHVVVEGLDPSRLPTPATGDGGVPAWVHLVGTYRAGVLTDAVATPGSRPATPFVDVPPPCTAPPGGWPRRPDDSNNVNMAPLDAYQAAHPSEVVGIATLYASANQPVAYLLTSGDAAAAEAALRPTNGAALCVAHSDVTPAQFAAARAAFPPTPSDGDGVFTTGGTNPAVAAAAEVSVVVVTPALAARAAAFPSGLVRFEPFLTPVGRTAAPEAVVVHDGDRVESDGLVYAAPGRPVRLCSAAPVPASSPTADPCPSGVTVTGVDLDTLPGRSSSNGVVSGNAHLVGTYRDGTLAVDTQSPIISTTIPVIGANVPPCPTPEGGWPAGPAGTETNRLYDYQRAHQDEVLFVTTLRPTTTQTVALVVTTDDGAAARAALGPVFGASLCVLRAEVDVARLRAAQAAFPLSDPAMRAAGAYELHTSYDNPLRPVVETQVLLVTPDLAAKAAPFPGLIHFDPLLAPVP